MNINETERHGIYFHVGQNIESDMEQDDINEYDVYFHVGDKVRVDGNAKNTIWETGIITDLNKDGALINYGDRWSPIYGMGRRVRTSKLEMMEQST